MTNMQEKTEAMLELINSITPDMVIESPLDPVFTIRPADSNDDVKMNGCEGADCLFLPGYRIANAISWMLSADTTTATEALDCFEEGFGRKLYDDQLSVLVASASPIDILPNRQNMDAFVIPNEGQIPVRHVSAGPELFDQPENRRFTVVLTESGNYSFWSTESRTVIRIKGFTEDVNRLLIDQGQDPIKQGKDAVLAFDLGDGGNFVQGDFEALSVFNDPNLHRQMKVGVYGWTRIGLGAYSSKDHVNAVIGSMPSCR